MPGRAAPGAPGTMAGAPIRRAALALIGSAAVAAALPPATPFAGVVPDAGWSEAVVIVSDLARMAAFLGEVAGWRVVRRGRTDAAALRLWGLPAGARGEEWRVANAGDAAGFVRLVRLSGAGGQRQIRSSAMPWDTGGVFSLMTRSRDAWAAFRAAQRLGYGAFNDPVEFTFGGVRLRNVVLRGPDGVNLAVYERVAPPLTGWTTIRRLSAPFNAMQTVRDHDATRAFWAGLMGYAPVAAGAFVDPVEGPNNFALPHNLVRTVERRYAIMAVAGGETGRVEAMQFAGLTGRDLAPFAAPPNLGIAALRFPTRRLDAALAWARVAGRPVAGPVATVLEPYGAVRLARVTSPDGVQAELFAARA